MKLFNEDVLDAIKYVEDESVDLIVTDCPYHIVSGGCSKGEYGNKSKEPSGVLNRRYKEEVARGKHGEHILKGTKHVSLNGILNDNDMTTYCRQGKLFKHNEIKFSEWLPELYRVLKPGKHIYIHQCKEFKRVTTMCRRCRI